jgi:exopolysaccharide production protein ExoZ
LKSGLHPGISDFLHRYEVDAGKYRIVPMEGLRGLAVLLVFFVHFHALFGETLARESWSHHVLEFLGTIGNAGVDLFFVMSGFLIYGALIRRETPFWSFMRRRVERIYPTFLAVFAVYLSLSIAFPTQNKIHGSALGKSLYVLANLFLLPGIFNIQPIITVAWSLSYEFFFYLLLPLLILIFGARKRSSNSRIVAIAIFWLSFGALSLFAGVENRTRMISFVSGMILYEITASGRVRNRLGRFGEWATVAAVLASFILFYAVHRPRAHSTINAFVPIMLLSASFFLVSLYSFELQGVLSRSFSWSPLRFLGNMSYSYYLIHGLTLQALAFGLKQFGMLRPSAAFVWAMLPIAFAATWTVSTFLFLGVEKRYSLAPRSAAMKTKRASDERDRVLSTRSTTELLTANSDLPHIETK